MVTATSTFPSFFEVACADAISTGVGGSELKEGATKRIVRPWAFAQTENFGFYFVPLHFLSSVRE
jgi:hypothetical protein